MSSDPDDIREELREEVRELKKEIREEVLRALRSSTAGIRVDIGKEELDQAAPSAVVVRDIVGMIRNSVRSSLVEKGERAVDELVEGMPETGAAELLKSLANTERLKIVKLLYSSPRTFSDLKAATGLEAASVSHHLKSILKMGLIAHGDSGGYELTKRGRVLVRTLTLMHEALGGESVD